MLAVGAVHQHLLKTQQRPRVGLFVECGDAREVSQEDKEGGREGGRDRVENEILGFK